MQSRARGIPHAPGGALEETPQGSEAEAETSDCELLVVAARNGDTRLAQALLRRGAKVDSLDARGKSPLHRAAKYHRLQMVQLLIRAKANIELPTADMAQMRPLHFAAKAGSAPIVLYLLAHGADAGAANAQGQNAAGIATANPQLQEMLLEQLHEASSLGKRFPSAQLVVAAARGDVGRCRALLLAGADPDSNDGRLTALQRAVSERQLGAVRMLIEAGANVALASSARDSNCAAAYAAALESGIGHTWDLQVSPRLSLHLVYTDPVLWPRTLIPYAVPILRPRTLFPYFDPTL